MVARGISRHTIIANIGEVLAVEIGKAAAVAGIVSEIVAVGRVVTKLEAREVVSRVSVIQELRSGALAVDEAADFIFLCQGRGSESNGKNEVFEIHCSFDVVSRMNELWTSEGLCF